MADLFGDYVWQVRTYECGPNGFATLPAICNYLQEAASLNAEALAFSKTNFEAAGENISWVLTRLTVRMDRYPRWEDEVVVETFPRGGRKIAAWRDFEIKDAGGAVLGAASSEWMLIDLTARKTVAVPQAVLACIDDSIEPALGTNPFTKLRFPDGCADPAFSSRAQKSNIDLNGHVNNVRYIEWMLEPCRSARPEKMEVVFRGEAFAGDGISVSVVESNGNTLHRVFSPDGKDYIIAQTAFGG
jgi:fatty acyl-ACP thioesterase A